MRENRQKKITSEHKDAPPRQSMEDEESQKYCNNPCMHGTCGVCVSCAGNIREGAVIGAWTTSYIPWKLGLCLGQLMDCFFCNHTKCLCGEWCPTIKFSLPVPEAETFDSCNPKGQFVPTLGKSNSYRVSCFECLFVSTMAGAPAIAGGIIGGTLGVIPSVLCCPCSFFGGVGVGQQHKIAPSSLDTIQQLEEALVAERLGQEVRQLSKRVRNLEQALQKQNVTQFSGPGKSR